MISGPVLSTSSAGVGARTVEEAGTQKIPQRDISVFVPGYLDGNAESHRHLRPALGRTENTDPITEPSQVSSRHHRRT